MSNKSKTILLVEDEAIIAVIHKKILSRYGFDVITAGTGEKGVEIAGSNPEIDLILMDINLGDGIDGTEAAERILADKEIPLVFLSSHTEPEVVNKTEGITSYGYIVKNSGETVLIAAIKMAFRLFEAKKIVQCHLNQQEILVEILLELHKRMHQPFEDLMNYAIETSVKLTESTFAFAGLLSEDESVMTIHAWSKDAMSFCAIDKAPMHFPINHSGVWGECVRTRKPVIINDYDSHAGKRGYPEGHVPITNFMAVPIFDGDRITAVGAVANSSNPFEISDVRSLISLYERLWEIIRRKQFEEALRISEEKYRVLFEDSPEAYFIIDETVIVDCNKASLSLMRSERELIIGKSPNELSPEYQPSGITSKEMMHKKIGEVFSKGKTVFDWIHARPDGSEFRAEVSLSVISLQNKPMIFSSFRDISDKIFAISLMQKTLNRFKALLENSPSLIAIFDSAGINVEVSKAMANTYGMTPDELRGKTFYDLLPGEIADDFMKTVNKLKEGRELIVKTDAVVLNGEERIYESRLFPIDVEDEEKELFGSIAIDITDRIKSEEGVKLAEETYRNLFLNSQIGIFRSEVETGIILDANETFARFAGYKDRESLLADSFNVAECYVDPEQRNIMISTLKRTGEVNNFETLFKRIDDNLIWMRFSAKHNSEKGWLEGVAEDITEARKAADQLRESEALLQKIIDNIPLSLTIVTVEGIPRYVNPRAIKLFEAESLESLQNLGASFVWENPEDRSKWIEALKVRGVVNNYEAVIITLSGERKFLLLSGLLIHYRGELCVLSIHSDITDRKLYEIALRESEEKYRMLFNHSPMGIYVADSDGNILDANDKLLSILGSPSLEATKSLNIFTLPLLDETGYADKFRESVKTKTVSSIEFTYTSKWGVTTFASNYIVPVADSAGRVGKVFTLVEDITVRKRVEKYRELSGEILYVLNSADDLKDSVQRILLLIKEKTGSDAVGIRLCEGDDFPYFIQNGFSNDFILQENSLISRDTCDDICVNDDGDVSLECTCGLVISGKTDPGNPLFTTGGSCWTNDSFPLLEMPESEDPRYKARNNCIHHGYASVALVPVKSRNEIVGLLQLNGYAKNLFTLELVQELEIIAGRIGETLLRKQNEDKIKALLKEKELLLKETHHRVKNNMNTVYGLLYMQSEELSDPVSKSIIMEAAFRVQSMMVMYDKLYRSENHHEMNVNDYLPSLIAEIIRIFDSRTPVKTDISVDDIVLSAKILSALGIIINELITNSMKYAFNNMSEGLISLSLSVKEKKMTVIYRDNGPGLPESVNFENSTGFGMQLIGMLVQQIDGTISIKRDEGTRFILEFDV